MDIRIADAVIKRSRSIVFIVASMVGLSVVAWQHPTIENSVRDTAASMFTKNNSGRFVVVEIDKHSTDRLDTWPWPRSTHGKLIDKLSASGVSKVVFDVVFGSPAADPTQDVLLRKSIANSKAPVYMAASSENVLKTQDRVDTFPPATLGKKTPYTSIWVNLDDKSIARDLTYGLVMKGRKVPTMATVLAGREFKPGGYPIDWSHDPNKIDRISYSDVLTGQFKPGFFKGKTVVVGATALDMGDRFASPNYGRIAGVYIQVIGAETLLQGAPVQWGGAPLLILAILLVAASLTGKVRPIRILFIIASTTLIIATKISAEALTSNQLDIAPAAMTMTVAIGLIIAIEITTSFMRRITLAPGTGLPNLTAMRLSPSEATTTIVVRVSNYVEINAHYGEAGQIALLRQVSNRLALASGEADIYQVDDHSFAWRSQNERADVIGSVEGLQALFIGGLPVNGTPVDVRINVGICDDVSVTTIQSATNAMLAAERARHRGINYEIWETEDDDAQWQLSLLTEVDHALTNGQIWVAYQPKHDVETASITGAEALVRWEHPERGNIRPDKFIPIVETSGRIEALTLYVLECAIRDFANLDQSLSVAVNVSMRLIGQNKLAQPIRNMLARYGMAPERLVLELTESAAMTGVAGIGELKILRDIGLKISIDDYGTGHATLKYLQQINADELKIDQSFIHDLLTNTSNQQIVRQTMMLAHSLGLRVVAEGVENEQVQKMLETMGCDVIQGYHIGRPADLSSFNLALQADIKNRTGIRKKRNTA